MLNNNYKTNNSDFRFQRTSLVRLWFAVAITIILCSCVKHQYKAAPIQIEQTFQKVLSADPHTESFRQFLQANNHVSNEWPIKKWDLNALIHAAVYFNPAIKVAQSELAIYDAKEVIAGQGPNPSIGIPLEHHSETGDSPWLIGIVGDFLFERQAKRDARLKQVDADKQAAKIKLERHIWTVYYELHRSYIAYFNAVKQKEFLQTQYHLLQENLGLLERRLELGQVSQFEVSSIRLELQHIQLRISDQDYAINNAFHKLIANTGLQADKFEQRQLVFDEHLLSKEYDGKYLQEKMLNKRFDIRIKLKEYQSQEAALKLEIEKQYPDLNLSPGFIFDQGDRIWALGAAWVLPLFHNNEGQILEALARREHMQAEFIQLQTSILNEFNRKYQNYTDKLSSYNKTKELVSKLKARAAQIDKQFELGYADSLSVIRSKLEIEKANEAMFAINVDVLRILEEIEGLMQQPLRHEIDISMFIELLSKIK